MSDGVEGAALWALASAQTHQITSTSQHLISGSSGEGEEQNPIRSDSPVEEARHTRCQRPGLARTCARHDHQRGLTVGRHRQLCFVESLVPGQMRSEHMFVY